MKKTLLLFLVSLGFPHFSYATVYRISRIDLADSTYTEKEDPSDSWELARNKNIPADLQKYCRYNAENNDVLCDLKDSPYFWDKSRCEFWRKTLDVSDVASCIENDGYGTLSCNEGYSWNNSKKICVHNLTVKMTDPIGETKSETFQETGITADFYLQMMNGKKMQCIGSDDSGYVTCKKNGEDEIECTKNDCHYPEFWTLDACRTYLKNMSMTDMSECTDQGASVYSLSLPRTDFPDYGNGLYETRWNRFIPECRNGYIMKDKRCTGKYTLVQTDDLGEYTSTDLATDNFEAQADLDLKAEKGVFCSASGAVNLGTAKVTCSLPEGIFWTEERCKLFRRNKIRAENTDFLNKECGLYTGKLGAAQLKMISGQTVKCSAPLSPNANIDAYYCTNKGAKKQ